MLREIIKTLDHRGLNYQKEIKIKSSIDTVVQVNYKFDRVWPNLTEFIGSWGFVTPVEKICASYPVLTIHRLGGWAQFLDDVGGKYHLITIYIVDTYSGKKETRPKLT